MAQPHIGVIRMFRGNFAPTVWMFCEGQILPISENETLFQLIGTTYGGDGESTFALPNLQGSAPMHPGQGPGLSLHDLGETSGSETVTLLITEMPAHNHTPVNARASGGQANPTGNMWGTSNTGKVAANFYAPAAGIPVVMNSNSFEPVGGSQPHNNMMPYLTLNFCIALQGVYPPRS